MGVVLERVVGGVPRRPEQAVSGLPRSASAVSTAAEIAVAVPVASDTGVQADYAAKVARSKRKRLLDIVLSSCGLVVLAPIFAILALVIVVDSGFPIFYGQKRIAFDRRRGARRNPRERPFRCWKFRTMVRGAEQMRDQLAALNTAPFPTFKIRRDPRVTRVGRFLRRSSLDELPQLWNVLRGEMSIVGPRPPLPEEVASYDDFALQRLAVRPGLTCLWQINQRHQKNPSFRHWVEQDLEYIRSWSPATDLVLVWKTALAVVRLTGE